MSAVIVASLATRDDVQSARGAVEGSSVAEDLALVLDAGAGGASAAALRDAAVQDLVRLAGERGIAVHAIAPEDAILPASLDRVPRHESVLDAFRALLPTTGRSFRGRFSLP